MLPLKFRAVAELPTASKNTEPPSKTIEQRSRLQKLRAAEMQRLQKNNTPGGFARRHVVLPALFWRVISACRPKRLIACTVITAPDHLRGAADEITSKNNSNVSMIVSVIGESEARKKLQKSQ